MTSQVIFKIDKKIKDKAMKKAEREGVPFASVLKLATKAYAEDRLDIGFVHEEFNAKTRREISQAIKDYGRGKNVSPRFSNANDAVAWLKR